MPTTNQDEAFRLELISFIPHVRAFARSLVSGHEAEDIAQDAVASAWRRRDTYTPGTNFKAWLFTITRNQFYSLKRRDWRSVALDPEVAEKTLVATENATATLELDELRRALQMLPPVQREALILIGAGGLSYEEASTICGVAIGTIKSRVSRARDHLALIYAEGEIDRDGESPSVAIGAIMRQVASYSEARCA